MNKLIFYNYSSILLYWQSPNPKINRNIGDKNNKPKLVGFSYSRFYTKGKKIRDNYGSLCYACPEIIQNDFYNPELADVWSLGVCLYVMLCGYLPFSEEDDEKNNKLIISGKVDYPSEIGNICKDLLKKMLEVNPKKRLNFLKVSRHPWVKTSQDVKIIGATTDIEYNTYVVRDRAFLRRFDRVDVMEQSEEVTVKVLMGTLPKYQKKTGIKFKYNDYVTELLIQSIVEATSEFKRVYGLGAMYPDISFSVLGAAYSNALYQNREFVTIEDVYMAIKNSKRIYPDSRIKELDKFREKFKDMIKEEGITLPIVTLDEINESEI